MKKWIIMGLLMWSVQPAFAILSPLNQSIEEIVSIVQSTEVGKKIPQGQAITSISHSGNGYLLSTRELQMQVDIQYLPSNYPGKQQFSLVFHAPVPLSP